MSAAWAASVSVVVPTYNAAAFLPDTLRSVAAQTRLPVELIVVDDRSTDDTVAVAEAWGRTAPFPVRVIALPQNSGGPAGPLNDGVEAAHGEYIATLDHDDRFPPGKLATQVAILERHQHFGLVFGDLEFDGPDAGLLANAAAFNRRRLAAIPMRPLDGGAFEVGRQDALAAVVRSSSFVGTCSNVLFPKAAWRACGGFDEGTTVSCDLAFLAAVAARFDLGYVPGPSAVWRLHPASFYRSATEYARIVDQLTVFAKLARAPLSEGVRSELRGAVREIAYDGAFRLRQGGDHRRALAVLWRGMRIAGPWRAGMLSLVKLLPHKLLQSSAGPSPVGAS